MAARKPTRAKLAKDHEESRAAEPEPVAAAAPSAIEPEPTNPEPDDAKSPGLEPDPLQDPLVIDRQVMHPGVYQVLRFFSFSHLPEHLQQVSAPFAALAQRVAEAQPQHPETTVALRKLLEAKDAAVRAAVAPPL